MGFIADEIAQPEAQAPSAALSLTAAIERIQRAAALLGEIADQIAIVAKEGAYYAQWCTNAQRRDVESMAAALMAHNEDVAYEDALSVITGEHDPLRRAAYLYLAQVAIDNIPHLPSNKVEGAAPVGHVFTPEFEKWYQDNLGRLSAVPCPLFKRAADEAREAREASRSDQPKES